MSKNFFSQQTTDNGQQTLSIYFSLNFKVVLKLRVLSFKVYRNSNLKH